MDPGATILGICNTKRSLIHLNSKALAAFGIKLDLATNLPDVIVHHPAKNWLLLIDAIIGTGPIDDNRRKELKDVFSAAQRDKYSSPPSRTTATCNPSSLKSPGNPRSG